MEALERKHVPYYLCNILRSYLSNRRVYIRPDTGDIIDIEVSCGVPQGSVLGPDLWNILYDDLLPSELPHSAQTVAFADDVTLVATADVTYQLEVSHGEALGTVVG